VNTPWQRQDFPAHHGSVYETIPPMNPETPANFAASIPVTARERVAVPAHKIPLAAKVAGTIFLAPN